MGNVISRRALLKASAYGAVGATLARPLEAIAGPFMTQDYRTLVPRDKKLDPAWVRSLTERGEEPWVSGEDLKYIGMPVGGFFAGTVYLGGDGTLWNWDIFNQHHQGGIARPGGVKYGEETLNEIWGANYVDPPEQQAPFKVQFALDLNGEVRYFNKSSWSDVSFLGQYPIGTVKYQDEGAPVNVTLQAFSPFVPLDVEVSSFPAIIMRFTVINNSDKEISVRLIGAFDRALPDRPSPAVDLGWSFTYPYSDGALNFVQQNPPVFIRGFEYEGGVLPDIPFADFESGTYEGWTATGTAFGEVPRNVNEIAEYQGDVNPSGEWFVNSHNTRRGEDVTGGDAHTGRLISSSFEIERGHINFKIGGGNHVGKTCLNLVIDGEVVCTATGRNSNRMHFDSFDCNGLRGQVAHLELVDNVAGPWGNIGLDDVVFSDVPRFETALEDSPDYGSFCIATIEPVEQGYDRPRIVSFDGSSEQNRLREDDDGHGLAVPLRILPHDSRTVTFIVAWHFPNLQIPGFPGKKRWYASKWSSAYEVAQEIAENIDELTELTFKWRDTWYDSTLPYWFLDRTFANTSILATNTCHRFDDGRFWFWEGIGCCHGTCTHVWSYAQAAARLFPEIESYFREHIDFGEFFHEDTGAIDYRGEFARTVAHDGQLGCIMRAYREHTMQRDSEFLRRIWPNVKKAMQFIIAQDPERNGLLEGSQYNTLDAAWYGPMSWLSSMYLAGLRASQAMANEMGDQAFAGECQKIIDQGSKNIVTDLFDGEYFFHKPDPAHPEANATGVGCHIDQLYGQSWCHWMGLERVVPADESKKAMANLYKYNFTPDVGPYRRGMKVVKGGRWYAMPGEGGLLMTTFPKGGAERAAGEGGSEWAAMYFNECMTGFEYQAAAHMVAEGLVEEGLAVTRMIHDRYSPSKRNPYNEIECSDHYGRAMASFGVYWNLCGFKVHGPRGQLSIDPKLDGDFRCAFVAPDGWGTIRRDGSKEYKHKK